MPRPRPDSADSTIELNSQPPRKQVKLKPAKGPLEEEAEGVLDNWKSLTTTYQELTDDFQTTGFIITAAYEEYKRGQKEEEDTKEDLNMVGSRIDDLEGMINRLQVQVSDHETLILTNSLAHPLNVDAISQKIEDLKQQVEKLQQEVAAEFELKEHFSQCLKDAEVKVSEARMKLEWMLKKAKEEPPAAVRRVEDLFERLDLS